MITALPLIFVELITPQSICTASPDGNSDTSAAPKMSDVFNEGWGDISPSTVHV